MGNRTGIFAGAVALGLASLPVLASPASAVTPACGTSGTPAVVALQDSYFHTDFGLTPVLASN